MTRLGATVEVNLVGAGFDLLVEGRSLKGADLSIRQFFSAFPADRLHGRSFASVQQVEVKKINTAGPVLAPSVPGRVTIENLMEIPELTMFSADTDSVHQFF